MASFGPAVFIHSRYLNANVLKCKSTAHPGMFYRYVHMLSKSTKFGFKSYYSCLGCRKVSGKRGTISRVSVLWNDYSTKVGHVTADPDMNHVAGCLPASDAEILAAEMEKEVFKAVRSGKRPCDAHHSIQASIPKRARK